MQKYVNFVDLGESFPTSIYLQKSASIRPRTSPSKFGGKYSILFTGVLRPSAVERAPGVALVASSGEVFGLEVAGPGSGLTLLA